MNEQRCTALENDMRGLVILISRTHGLESAIRIDDPRGPTCTDIAGFGGARVSQRLRSGARIKRGVCDIEPMSAGPSEVMNLMTG
ncbi:MAG: hypothetical protein FJ179_08830 [Gammaproteobacteria bacterium]|nr:hypothetical protein [Gammaproteobacteria bacterium]